MCAGLCESVQTSWPITHAPELVTFSKWLDSVQGLEEAFDHLSLPLAVEEVAQSS